MITNFYVSRSIISFKNSSSKLVDKYPTVKNWSLTFAVFEESYEIN